MRVLYMYRNPTLRVREGSELEVAGQSVDHQVKAIAELLIGTVPSEVTRTFLGQINGDMERLFEISKYAPGEVGIGRKVTPEMRKAILEAEGTGQQIADRFGVGKTTINNIRREAKR